MLAATIADLAGRGRRLARLAGIPALALLLPTGFAAAQTPVVSFDPAPQSPDYVDLFTQPERWAEARRHVNIFVVGDAHLKHASTGNSLDRLVAADAFRKLRQWGIKIEIVVGAIKEWDCAANTTPGRTLGDIAEVHRNGGDVQFVGIDEPLRAGIRPAMNGWRACGLTIAGAAQEVAAFARAVDAGAVDQKLGPAPGIIDIEPYPSVQLDQHEAYVEALLASGLHPAGYVLDIAVAQIDRRSDLQQRFPSELRALAAFLQARNVQLGIIVWSSRGMEPTDQAYYDDALAFTRLIHGIIGQPPRVLFSSWVLRCARGTDKAQCPKTVPLNLPEHGPNVFSHTRLILDALDILAQH